MATPPVDGTLTVKLNAEIEGEEIGSRNYRFSKIGEPVPVFSDRSSEFDSKCLPSQPLAVSERFRLLFVAHPQGFCVVRTIDVMTSAEKIRDSQGGQSVQELSLLDVSIQNVSILCLSADDSMLAATVDNQVHFYSVNSLLHKEKKPSYSVRLDVSGSIKEMQWSRKIPNAYVVLSTCGKLFRGTGHEPLRNVLEDVDSVDWSVEGNHVAAVKRNSICILTPELKETLRFSLQFESDVGDCDADVDRVIKVDSIRWIRSDCIIIGCFELNDEEDENYVVHVITSQEGRIVDAASKLNATSFKHVFMDFCSDAVLNRIGSHLFLSYLELHGIALIGSRHLSQHVGLLCWPPLDKGKNEVSMIEILNDAWNLYIDSQGNGDENIVLGLSVDKVSKNENVKFILGDEDTEVSPSCVIICLTIDGKISVFHFACAAGTSLLPEDGVSDVGGNTFPVSVKADPRQASFSVGNGSGKQTVSSSESQCWLDKEETEAKSSVYENIGQKSVERVERLKPIEPPNSPPAMSDQNSMGENQPISEVKSSTGFFSKEVCEPPKPVSPLSAQNGMEENNPISEVESGVGGSSEKVVGKPQSPLRYQSKMDENQPVSQLTSSTGLFSGKFIDKPVQPLSPMSKQNSMEENQPISKIKSSVGFIQSTSGVKSSAGLFSEKFVLEPPKQPSPMSYQNSMVKNQRGASLFSEKVGHFSNHPVTLSNVAVPLFNEIDGSNKSPSQASGFPQNSSVVNEKAKPSAKLTSFGHSASPGWLGTFTPAYSDSQMEMKTGKSAESNYNRDPFAASTISILPKPAQNVSKTFGKVEEMAKKLDTLLEGIGGKGGFTDASLKSQNNMVQELEANMSSLSDRCRLLRGVMDEELKDVHLLLDKTVQVLARKVYLEGIFKQDADSRYWQLWNRQKLSSELELKRKHVFSLNQDLTNQLIELERHFNSLEFNKFGEDEELQRNHKFEENGTLQRSSRTSQGIRRHSRKIQSLSSLHYTMNAQLTAAEHLSNRLSEQMAVLSIDSCDIKQDVKQKLFDSIGLSYAGDSLVSPHKNRTYDTHSHSKQFTGSCSITKEQPIRNHTTSQGYEPETARRHRDLLDQSWTSFDPPKTILKRLILKEDRKKGSTNQSNVDEQFFTPHSRKKFDFTHPKVLDTSATSLKISGGKGASRILEKQFNEKPSGSIFQRKSPILDSEIQGSTMKRDLPSSKSKSITSIPNNGLMTSKSGLPFSEKKDSFIVSKCDTILESKSNSHSTPSAPMQLPSEYLSTSDLIGIKDHFKSGFTNSTPGDFRKKHMQTDNGLTSSEIQVIPTPDFHLDLNESDRVLPEKSSTKLMQPRDVSASTSSLSFLGASPSAMIVPSFSSSSLLAPENLSSISAFPRFVESESEKPSPIHAFKSKGGVEIQSSVSGAPVTEKDARFQVSPFQHGLETSVSDLKPGTVASSPISELSGELKSATEMDFGVISNNSSVVTSVVNLNKSHTDEIYDEISGNVKSLVSDSSQEEEMEEETSEEPQISELALGGFAGFGFGSTPVNSGPHFGAVSQKKDSAPVSPPFMMHAPPSGDLFRPASFSFPSQPPTAFSGGVSTGITGQSSSLGGFGQPAQIGMGQQALGSVLGSFGQSRQIGTGLTGGSVPGNSLSGGFTGGSPAQDFRSGFSSASTFGGFANLEGGRGGFASLAGGQFSSASTTPFSGGAFGAFSNQKDNSGAVSSFGNSLGNTRPPPELLTQMRK